MAATLDNTRRGLKRYFIKHAMKGRSDFLDQIKSFSGISTTAAKITAAPDFTHQIVFDTANGNYWIHIGSAVTQTTSAYWAQLT